MIQRISLGKYRYRGHIIWYDNFCYCCSPDPSDRHTRKKTLRGIVKYIDDWEAAFACGNVCGNIIGPTQETIDKLFAQISELTEIMMGRTHFYPSIYVKPIKWSDVLVNLPSNRK